MITSNSNSKIKEAINIKKRHASLKESAFFIEGVRLIESALKSGIHLIDLFYTDRFAASERGAIIISSVKKRGGTAIHVSETVMTRLSDTETPQGVLCIASKAKEGLNESVTGENSVLLVCDGIKDPGNMGAVIRSADALACDAVICTPDTCNPFSPKAVRASAGSVFNIPLIFEQPENIVNLLKQRDMKVVVSDPYRGEAVMAVDLISPFALVVGEEAAGVSEFFKSRADVFLNIPVTKRADSLNVAVSSAICLYEALRQRKK